MKYCMWDDYKINMFRMFEELKESIVFVKRGYNKIR